MGQHHNITSDRYPRQSPDVGKPVLVTLHNADCPVPAVIIRNDIEEPHRTIFQLNNGWVLLSTECQYQMHYPSGKVC